MILYISIIITQKMNSTQQSKNLRMYNITMSVRILIIITKRLMRHATGLRKPCGRNQVVVLQKSLTTTIWLLSWIDCFKLIGIKQCIHLFIGKPVIQRQAKIDFISEFNNFTDCIVPCLYVFGISHFGLYYLYFSTSNSSRLKWMEKLSSG